MSTLVCPFHIYDVPPKRGFSLGFQGLCICQDCTTEATEGHNAWRWQDNGECFRCLANGRVYTAAPNNNLPVAICERCLNAGHAYLSGAVEIPEPVKPPRRLTKAEQNSGNL